MAEEQAQAAEPAHKRPPNFCTYCNDEKPWDDPRAFGIHLERHREVLPPVEHKGKVVSTPCPNGCGRHFIRPSMYREHVPLCDGSSPLWNPMNKGQGAPAPPNPPARPAPPPEESAESQPEAPSAPPPEEVPVAKDKVKCPDCGAGPWKDMRGVAAHRRKQCPAKGGSGSKERSEPMAPERPTKKEPKANEGNGSDLAEQLRAEAKAKREEAEALVQKADKLDEMAKELETLLQ